MFSKTKHNSFWSSIFPDQYILGQFSPEKLNKIRERQKKAVDDFKSGKIDNPRAAVIWDDYNGRDIKYNEALDDWYYTGRHFQTMSFFNAQHITLTPPPIRSNTEVAVLFNTDYGPSIEHYYNDFASKMDKKQFYNMFREYTEKRKHGFLMIDADKPYEEKFFHGKADVLPVNPEYIGGCPEYWHGSEKQLKRICDGSMHKDNERVKELAEPDSDEDDTQEEMDDYITQQKKQAGVL